MSLQRSGQIAVATAGTAVRGPNRPGRRFSILAHPDNVGDVYVGNDGAGDVASGTGYVLEPGDVVEIYVANLDALWFDAAQNNGKFCWLLAER